MRYTDALGRKLRWTCISFTRSGPHGSWAAVEPAYGDAHCKQHRKDAYGGRTAFNGFKTPVQAAAAEPCA